MTRSAAASPPDRHDDVTGRVADENSDRRHLFESMEPRVTTVEWVVAALLTLVVVSLHFIEATSAGALWRDEAGTVGLATLPSFSEVWNNLQHEAFPVLWLLLVRMVASVAGPLNDSAFRALGFCIGVGIVGAIWWYARVFKISTPLLALALLAMSPSLLKYGDSVRAYGLGILLILVAAALLWQFIQAPGPSRYGAAAVSAIASVHALFYNPVLLAALCCGGFAVCARNHAWKKAALVVSIGALAAISLLPYVTSIEDARSWNRVFRIPNYTFGSFLTKLEAALRVGGTVALAGWIAAFVLALILGAVAVARPARFNILRERQEIVLFHLVALVSTVLGIFLFLDFLSYSTETWYYLPLLALGGVSIDAILGSLVRRPMVRLVRLGAVLLLAATTFLPARRAARSLETNVDIAALKLGASARNGDLILVDPWFYGVPFSRYYHGKADWVTVPQLNFHRFHRYDLLMEKMEATDQAAPIRPVLEGVDRSLRSGHRIYLVGTLELPAAGHYPVTVKPAPLRGNTRPAGVYEKQWSSTVGFFLRQHAVTLKEVSIYPPAVFNLHENVRLFVAEGWRP